MQRSIVLLSVLALLCGVQAFSTTIDATREECFIEEGRTGQPMGLMFTVTQGGFLDIDVQIKAPDGRVVYSAERQHDGKYNFIAHTDGPYNFCFGNRMSTLTPKQVSVVVVADEADRPPQPANDKAAAPEDLSPLAETIKNFADTVKEILEEQEYMKMRERAHRNTNDSTNARVVWWSFFEVAVLVTMSLGQIYYLRKFFETKRPM
ncbi:hypothetical protein PROFUN_13633 [Planoprotostelium fungivorum]|uniref:GOLD domain-containing protein n=1 Tax=Planoprotostelium fungivorum TaxID=1890364 RepID=A0A2P6MZZ3_9EUKA|nr:hypothetical protein PROFUN_13633 [Planoprotostelium fungivorum]